MAKLRSILSSKSNRQQCICRIIVFQTTEILFVERVLYYTRISQHLFVYALLETLEFIVMSKLIKHYPINLLTKQLYPY